MVQTLDGHWQTQPTDGHFSFLCVWQTNPPLFMQNCFLMKISVFSVLCIYLTHPKLLLLRIKAQRRV